MFNSLSGRFLLLTALFVMVAEVLIFVPSVARFRQEYLVSRIERAQIASLGLLAADEMIDPALEAAILKTAGVLNVVLVRDDVRRLMLSSNVPEPVSRTFEMRGANSLMLVEDAVARLADPEPRVIRVLGEPAREDGQRIEVTMQTRPLRNAMIDYGLRILALSAVISVVTAALLFLAVRRFMVTPIKRVVAAMASYAAAPEDTRRIIEPTARLRELREAETTLQSLQTQLTAALRQKERLAQLGGAVAKISHDLRNILASGQLLADRMESSADPAVKRAAPKLVGALSRAVNLCETTLAFGKAQEPPPTLTRAPLAGIVEDVLENERLAEADERIRLSAEIPPAMAPRADPEQLFRVLSNLVRNARQAIAARGGPGEVRITGEETATEWRVTVCDTGPGLPERAREHLFQPFQGGAQKDGTGLGLAIAAELVRGHGGRLDLVGTGADGTEFAVRLPKQGAVLDAAAE